MYGCNNFYDVLCARGCAYMRDYVACVERFR